MPGPHEWTIARNTFQFHSPDVLFAQLRGRCDLEEATQTIQLYQALGEVRPIFILCDMSEVDGMDSEAREYISEHMRPEWVLGIVFYNTRLLHRALGRGLLLAARMFHAQDREPHVELHFTSTREQALALVARLRQLRFGDMALQGAAL